MKKIILTLIISFLLFVAKSQTGSFSTINVGTSFPYILGDGTIFPSGVGDNRTLEMHATKLNVGQLNSYTYSSQNTAIFNVGSYSDNTEMVRFRTNGNSSYFNIVQVASKMRISFMQAGTPQLYLSETGNIGIGTSTPNTKLEVNGGNLLLTNNAKMYIGTYDASSFSNMGTSLLGVNGTAVFVKAKVAVYGGTWPDYVFSPTYKLRSLDSLEQFIQLNKHLPEVPTASDVEKNGIDLGNNQVLLLKKVEELTLIVIELNKRIEKLELTSKTTEEK